MRSQSALEYLTTYGWAILVISIVLGILVSNGFFNPGNYVTQQCVLTSGFSCISYFMSTNGILRVNIEQSTNNPINVTAIGCNVNGTTTNMQMPNNPPNNQIFMPVGSNYTFTVQCYSNGTEVAGNVGNPFSGTLVLNYTDDVSNLPNLAVGKLSLRLTPVGVLQVSSTTTYVSLSSSSSTVSSSTTTYTYQSTSTYQSTTTYVSSSSTTTYASMSTTTYLSSSSSTLSSTTTYVSSSSTTTYVSLSTTTYQSSSSSTLSSTTTYQSSSSSTLSSTTTYQSSSSSTLSSTTTYQSTTTTPATTTIHYLVVTLSNSQGTATSSNFQQMVQFVPSSYSSYEASDLGNIRFFTGNVNTGTGELHSWCETNCTSGASGQTLFWINLGSSVVPASGTLQINMSFEPTSTEYDAIYAGEAPQLSSTYGQYDNGASVFPIYTNFAGSSCPSGWSCQSGVTINNGATLAGAYINYTTAVLPQVIDTYVTHGDNSHGDAVIYALPGSGTTNYAFIINQPYWGHSNLGSYLNGVEYANTGVPNWINGVFSLGWNTATSTVYGWSNYTSEYTESTSLSSSSTYYVCVRQWNAADGSEIIQWVRTRAFPPSGVMPTASFGSVS